MIITSRKELCFSIAADRIMNGKEPTGFLNVLRERLLAGGVLSNPHEKMFVL